MTVRNLDRIFGPRSIAIVGASRRPLSIGYVVPRNVRDGGFSGPVMLVNPKYTELDGQRCYPDVASLPQVPDLAVICTPPETVPGLISQLGAGGAQGVIVITAGFGEGDAARGKALRQQMLDAARPHLLRILGPNCIGVMVPEIGLNASFAHLSAKPGKLAL